jgi:long-chain acyl-CoA synthetase
MSKVWLQHYDPGVPETIEYPDATIERLLATTAAENPEAMSIIFKGAKMTYGQLDNLVNQMTAALQRLGVQQGDRVAIHLPNCPQYVIAYYAILRAGAIAVPCNPVYVARELEHQISDAGAKVVITLTAFYNTIRDIRLSTPIEHVIVAQIKTFFPPTLRILFTLLREKKQGHRLDISDQANTYWLQDVLKSDQRPSPVRVEPSDTALLMYTGGTTGVSKGAQLTHRNLVVNAAQCAHWLHTTEKRPRLLTALPLFHSYAMTACMNHAIYTTGTMLLAPNPRDLPDVLQTIHKYKPTIYPGVPAMYVAINNSPEVAAGKYDVSSIEACISGAAGLPVDVQTRFQEITGGRLVEGYGLSEASPVTHINPIQGENRVGFIGIPAPDTSAKIVDLDTGTREVAPGEIGELCVQGPQVMKGYWNMPTETANVLRDGWLYTGDIATMTPDGYFQIVDRKKDMILGAGGYNVYPREIEDVLYAHPKVQEAVAAGISMGDKGERVKVWIVLKEGETATEQDILDYCRANLAPYKCPRFVEFRDELPKTLVGKILRRVLVEEEVKLAASD